MLQLDIYYKIIKISSHLSLKVLSYVISLGNYWFVQQQQLINYLSLFSFDPRIGFLTHSNSEMSASSASSSSSRRENPRSVHKIYRTPPTPDGSERIEREKGFILDCNAVRSISDDYSKSHPKRGDALPPYNAQCDGLTRRYWGFESVDKTLKRTGQVSVSLLPGGINIISFISNFLLL